MMVAFFNFNTPKPKRFRYRPLYYDARRERLEKMKAQSEAGLSAGDTVVHYTGLQKGYLKRYRESSKLRWQVFEKRSILLRLAIICLLIAVMYYFWPELFVNLWDVKGK